MVERNHKAGQNPPRVVAPTEGGRRRRGRRMRTRIIQRILIERKKS
jgi:hypothetical protein